MAVDHNNPQSRDEEILIATIDGKEYNKNPQSRMEELLLELKETIEEGGGGGGTTNYNNLSNQPQVNGETLIGDKSGADLGLVDAEEGKGLSTNDYDDTEKAAVAAATSAITAMKDGSELDSFGDVEVALLDKADTSDLGTAAAKDSTNSVTSGSTDLIESGAVKDAIDAAVAAAYHHAGTKTVAQLTHDLLIAANEGNVYNITDSGTTTSDFIEGIGKTIDEGSNVGICKVGDVYMFDLLSGFVDTTNFVQKSQTAGLLNNDGTVNTTIESTVAGHTTAIASVESNLTTLDNEVNGDATTYPYADVITIEDAVPSNLADCNVKIEPEQDLHGYDHPWVGGAGKNKLPLTVDSIKALNTTGTWSGNAYTVNGITFTIQTDDGGNITGIKVTGTSTSTTNLFIANGMSADSINGRIMNGCPANGGADKYAIYCMNTNYGVVGSDFGDGVTLSNTEYNCQAFIQIANGYTIPTGGLTFYPMIRLATETDSTFAPYTNICPISGHTEASVQRDSGNLFDYSTCENKGIDDSGSTWNNSKRILSDFIAVKNNNYTVSFPSGIQFIAYANYNEQKEFVSRTLVEATEAYSFAPTTPYIKLYFSNVNTNIDISKNDVSTAQFELGSTATPYVPYAGKTYTISLGDTIYGGTVDFDTGIMTVDRAVVDLGDLTWLDNSSDSVFWTNDLSPVRKLLSTDALCSAYEVYNQEVTLIANAPVGKVSFQKDNNARVIIKDLSYTDVSTFTAAVTGQKLCYELATPTTIQLTPQQIQLLKGQNTLTASTGDISVTVNGVSGSIGAVQEQVNELAEDVALKQNATDNNLQTTDKTVVGAVNELKSGLTEFGSYTTVETLVGKWNDVNLYRKLIQIQSLPNNGSITIQTGMTCQVVMLTGYAEQNGYTITIPYTAISGGIVNARLQSYGTELIIATTADFSAYKGYVVIYYTR